MVELENRILYPFLTFPAYLQSPFPHWCPSPSASEMEAEKNHKDFIKDYKHFIASIFILEK